MRRLIARRHGGRLPDSGAYAILYAVLVVVLVGMGAIVVDFASVRQDRRLDRSAADNAVLGGAELLAPGGTPKAACLKAWDYLKNTLRLSASDISGTPCNNFNGIALSYCATATPPNEIQDPINISGNRRVIVAWPVPSTSQFLTPELAPGTAQQNFNTKADGTSLGCDRLGVAVIETEKFGLGGALKASGTQTQVHSVAKFNPAGGETIVPVPLVVLDPTTCNALEVGGGGNSGSLVVRGSLDGIFPGGIAVDSDASGGETNCQGGKTPIVVSNNSYIWSLDSVNGDPGVIRSFAHTQGVSDANAFSGDTSSCPASGSPWLSVAPATLPPHPGLCRLPNVLSFPRATSTPWINRYNCDIVTSACPQPTKTSNLPSPRNYVDQWVTYATGTAPTGFATTVLSGGTCTLAAGTYTDVYSTCGTLTISGTVRITGKLVALHDVSITNSNCLLVNDSDTAHCTSRPADVVTSTRGADNGGIYVGGGLTLGNQGSLVTNQSFMYLVGRFDINTSGVFALTAPYGTALSTPGICVPAASTTSAPTPACFEAMALWSPYAGASGGGTQNQLQGQTQLVVDGTVFTPNAAFFYGGGVANDQERAQFVTRRLSIQGSGRLTMTPDSSRGTGLPGGSIQLIR